jgi:hypothetical protein
MFKLRFIASGLLTGLILTGACTVKDDKDPTEPMGGAGGTAGSKPGDEPGEGGTENPVGGSASGSGGAAGDGGGDVSGGEGGALPGGEGGNGGTSGTSGTSGTGGFVYGEPLTPEPAAILGWREDFEGDAPGWSITGGVWGVGAITNAVGPQAFDGTGVAGTGLTLNYGVNNDAWLISPEIDVPKAKDKPRFAFRYWYDLAAGDTAYIYFRVDGGSWQNITTVNESGDGSWRQAVYDLSAYQDRTVEFGFRIYTNNANFGPGLFIDDARFETGGQPYPTTDGFEDGWGYWSALDGVWAIGKPTAPDGPSAFEGQNLAGTILSADYGTNDDAWLISPRIAVPAAKEEPRVSFNYWYELSTGDTAYMYYRVDGGSWQSYSTINESGDGSWRSITFPLGAFANRTVELGFRLYTNNSAFAPGVYLDDVRYQMGPVSIVKSQGFEDGWQGWSAYDGVWAVGEPTAEDGPEPHGGKSVAGTVLSGDYGTNDDAWLVSPRFAVPPDSASPSFSYYYWYELASGDSAYTYVRVNGGSWQQVSNIDQSGGGLWRRQVIDLSSYKDKTVEVGFRLYTNNSAFAPGVYIDDVVFDLE